MISINRINIPAVYSIDLYAINPKKKNVPERHNLILLVKQQIRRLTPEGRAFKTFDLDHCHMSNRAVGYPAGVM
jgi:hypothetical protein